MKPKQIDSLEELDCEFDLAFEGNSVRITLHSRGGSKASHPINPDYEQVLQLILERLTLIDSVIEDVRLASKPVIHLPPSQRRIKLDTFTIPIRLSEVSDLVEVRFAIRRGAFRANNTSSNKTHGNATKRIEIVASAPLPSSKMAEILEWGELAADQSDPPAPKIQSKSFLEGRLLLRTHYQRERSRALVFQAKAEFVVQHGRLFCEVCGFDFESTFGELGANFIEAHHEDPVSGKLESSETRVSDLRMVCPNCHRMLHRNGLLTVQDLRSKIAFHDSEK